MLIKFDKNGNEMWKKIIDTPGKDHPHGITIDKDNNIFISGDTWGQFFGCINKGKYDIFLLKLDSNGNQKWVKVVGSKRYDHTNSIEYDDKNGIYICGYTEGSLPGCKNKGGTDAFLIKFSTSP